MDGLSYQQECDYLRWDLQRAQEALDEHLSNAPKSPRQGESGGVSGAGVATKEQDYDSDSSSDSDESGDTDQEIPDEVVLNHNIFASTVRPSDQIQRIRSKVPSKVSSKVPSKVSTKKPNFE